MVWGRKKKIEIEHVLNCVPYTHFVTTSEVASKLNGHWFDTFNKLFYLEHKGYVRFVEIRTDKLKFSKTNYSWRRRNLGEEVKKELSPSIMEVLKYVPEDEFISTSRLAKVTKENNMMINSKLLYLESRGYVACFRAGPKTLRNRTHHWRKLTEKERREETDEQRRKIEENYKGECFGY